MKYDDASWHSGGNFPKDLPPEAAATHSGMFLAWCLLNGLAGNLHTDESPDSLAELKARKISPGAFLLRVCDGKFTDEDLSDEGNAFASAYFDLEAGKFLADYDAALSRGHSSRYHVPDTWDSFDRIAPTLARRYQNWKRSGSADEPPKPAWKFWR